MADVVKSHLDANLACSRRLLHRCPMCHNPMCTNMKQFFARSQKLIDSLQKPEQFNRIHQWKLQFGSVIRYLMS